jgi:hypothetical protein
MSSKDVQPKRSADDFKTGGGEFAHADGEVRGAPSRDRLSCAVSLTISRSGPASGAHERRPAEPARVAAGDLVKVERLTKLTIIETDGPVARHPERRAAEAVLRRSCTGENTCS